MMGEMDPSRPPSPASSPSREFSFAISLENSFVPQEKSEVDLSPADDIFFHGHLLPLRLFTHLPSSVPFHESPDSFTLPITDDLVLDDGPIQFPGTKKSVAEIPANVDECIQPEIRRNKKSKSFSLFGLQRRKMAETDEEAEHEKQSKRKLRFDVGQMRQAFKNMVSPFSMFRSRTEDDISYRSDGRKSNYWSSGNITSKNSFRKEVMRRGQYTSAPASMRASPINSRILVADIPSPKSTNDSTMEELQAAIQAAIAHCKNSIAKEEIKQEDSGS